MPDDRSIDRELLDLTTEQKLRADKAYLAAIDEAIGEALEDVSAGRTVPADTVWRDLDLDED